MQLIPGQTRYNTIEQHSYGMFNAFAQAKFHCHTKSNNKVVFSDVG